LDNTTIFQEIWMSQFVVATLRIVMANMVALLTAGWPGLLFSILYLNTTI